MSDDKKISVKEIAEHLVTLFRKEMQPKIDELKKIIEQQGKEIEIAKSKIQTLNSILINKSKHKKQ